MFWNSWVALKKLFTILFLGRNITLSVFTNPLWLQHDCHSCGKKWLVQWFTQTHVFGYWVAMQTTAIGFWISFDKTKAVQAFDLGMTRMVEWKLCVSAYPCKAAPIIFQVDSSPTRCYCTNHSALKCTNAIVCCIIDCSWLNKKPALELDMFQSNTNASDESK